jgi:hypothetical protein
VGLEATTPPAELIAASGQGADAGQLEHGSLGDAGGQILQVVVMGNFSDHLPLELNGLQRDIHNPIVFRFYFAV